MVIPLFLFILSFKSFNNFDFYGFKMDKLLNISQKINKNFDQDLIKECVNEFPSLSNTDNANYSNYYKINTNILRSFGKGFDDIGNELECLNSCLDTNFILTKLSKVKKKYSLSEYLFRNYSFLGLCVPNQCSKLIENIFNSINGRNFSLESNSKDKHNNYTINVYSLLNIKENNLYIIFFWLAFFSIAIKFIVGTIVKFKYPKGYRYHGYKLYTQISNNIENINEDNIDDNIKEAKNRKLINEELLNNEYINNEDNKASIGEEYNPIYDYEPFFPLYFRLLKYLDIFNNISILTRKRNRYYNENDIDILCPIKSIVLFYLIYNDIIINLIYLPNANVFNYNFYKDMKLSFFKRSINSSIFWIILESATFSFKLMKFIKKNIYIKKNKNNTFIIKQIFKFLLFYIPKIVVYFFVYFIFYYLFEYYTCALESKMIYHYISEQEIKTKKCLNTDNIFESILYLIFPFNYYYMKKSQSTSVDYIVICFIFTYIYSNMFYSSILFMLLLIFRFLCHNKIIDILLFLCALLNLIISYTYIYFNFEFDRYNFLHFSGEKYSILYPNIFFSIYFFGCLLGFCFYYYSEYKNSKRDFNFRTRTKSYLMNIKNAKAEIKESDENKLSKSSTFPSFNKYENDEIFFYKPMEFCKTFIITLKKTNKFIKIILLIIYIILSTFISTISYVLLRYYDIGNEQNHEINIKEIKPFKNLFFLEKNVNAFLFIFFICLVLVFPKTSLFIKVMKSGIFTSISRIGFFMLCIFKSLVYMLLCLFEIKVYMSYSIIFYMTIGIFIIVMFFGVVLTILIELPLRILIKNILKNDEKNQSKIILMNMT